MVGHPYARLISRRTGPLRSGRQPPAAGMYMLCDKDIDRVMTPASAAPTCTMRSSRKMTGDSISAGAARRRSRALRGRVASLDRRRTQPEPTHPARHRPRVRRRADDGHSRGSGTVLIDARRHHRSARRPSHHPRRRARGIRPPPARFRTNQAHDRLLDIGKALDIGALQRPRDGAGCIDADSEPAVVTVLGNDTAISRNAAIREGVLAGLRGPERSRDDGAITVPVAITDSGHGHRSRQAPMMRPFCEWEQ